MCHAVLQNPAFFRFLCRIDQELAAATRVERPGMWRAAARGGLPSQTPRVSVGGAGGVFLALELYLWTVQRTHNVAVGAVRRPPCVSGGGVDAGLTAGQRSAQGLCELFSIPARTLKRWRTWWREDFPSTPFWQSVRERFMPPVTMTQLPQSLLERFDAGAMTDRLVHLLRFVAPLSHAPRPRDLKVAAYPQRMPIA